MAKQKVIKQETEHGYRTPDGREYFPAHEEPPHGGPHIGFMNFDTEAGQEEARKAYRKVLRTQGVPEELADKLEFIQRVRTVTLSKVIPLPPREIDTFDEEAPRRTVVKKPRPF